MLGSISKVLTELTAFFPFFFQDMKCLPSDGSACTSPSSPSFASSFSSADAGEVGLWPRFKGKILHLIIGQMERFFPKIVMTTIVATMALTLYFEWGRRG